MYAFFLQKCYEQIFSNYIWLCQLLAKNVDEIDTLSFTQDRSQGRIQRRFTVLVQTVSTFSEMLPKSKAVLLLKITFFFRSKTVLLLGNINVVKLLPGHCSCLVLERQKTVDFELEVHFWGINSNNFLLIIFRIRLYFRMCQGFILMKRDDYF